MSGETIEIDHDSHGYVVRCWNADGELHWEVRGVVVGGDQFREQRRAYTLPEALAEFNRWR